MVHINGENVFIILNQSPFLKKKIKYHAFLMDFFKICPLFIPLNTNSLRIVTWLTKL